MCLQRGQIEKLGGVEADCTLVLSERDQAGAAATWRRSSMAAVAAIVGIDRGRDVTGTLKKCCEVLPSRKADYIWCKWGLALGVLPLSWGIGRGVVRFCEGVEQLLNVSYTGIKPRKDPEKSR